MNDIPHYPWNEGDKLFASELNAAIANAMATSGSAGRNIIDVSEIMRGDPNSGMDATPALQQALAIAAIAPGSVIYLCPGDWNFRSAVPVGPGTAAAINACFLVPSRTLIRGGGMGQTCLYWNDADETFNLFDAVPNASELTFQDFTIVGSWDRNLEGTGNGGYPLIIHNASAIRFHRVGSRFCRRNAIVTRYCYDIVCHECDIRYCAHGAIDHATCAMVIVSNNTIMHSDDNCIAVHSENFDCWGVRKNVIIVGNSIFDSVGIACIAPRSVLVAYNNLDCIRLVGITFHEYVPPTVGSNSAALGTVIANNNITNIINEWAFSGPPQIRNGNIGISLSGSSARAGNLPAIPGENVTNTTTVDGIVFPAGTIIDDTVYFGTNSTDPTVAVAISRGYTIIGNSVARTLPPCDGTATAVVGGTTKTYTKWSDYGFTDPVGNGWMFLKTGWVNPSLNVSQISGEGVRLGGGSIRDVLITNNEFRGLEKAVNFYLCQPKDVFVRSNLIVDCGTGFGAIVVDLSPTSGSPPVPDDPKLPARIYIEDNFIDVDPYQRHSNRLPRGQWNTNVRPQWPGAVWIQSGSGVVFRRNTVRNANVVVSNGPGGVTHVSDNWVEGFPAPIPNTPNAGIGVVPLDGTRLRHIESDPTSTHYGEIMSAPLDVSLSMPTTGLYLVGAYVTRTYTGPDANGAVLRGWVRLTTGATHVAGVDWTPVYDYTTSNDLTALPVVGASNGIVTSVVVNPQPGAFQFAISDPWPGVAIDAPGSGGTQATAHVPTLLSEIPGTIDTTTMGSDHNLGLVPLIAAQGLSYVVGETLTATGGAFTTPFQGTVDSIGSAGGVQRFIVTQGGKYSAFPPDPTNFSGTAGAGFALHLQTWALGAPLIVDGGGFYPNGTPNAVLTQTNGDRGGRLTVKMGQSFVGSPTGLMLAGNATAPLQAVPLQQLTSATAGGPFLPLTGGTVGGPTTFSSTLVAGGSLMLAGNATAPLQAVPLQQLTSAVAVAGPGPATTPPAMAGTAAVGISALFARGDHVHPSDTSRLSLATGGTVAGSTTFTASPAIHVSGAAGTFRTMRFETGGVARFSLTLDNTPENGTPSGTGSNFAISSFDDSGTALNNSFFQLNRLTGRTSLLGITQTATILGANLGTGTGTGFVQNAIVTGTHANPSALGINQWNVSSDVCALTGQFLFNTAISYNFGGGAYTGNRGGLLVNMTQTGAASATSGAGGIEGFQSSVTVNNTFGGTNTGPGAGGAIFAANLYTTMTGGASNLIGTCGLEIDVEARTGATYQGASGLTVVATTSHQAAGVLGNNAAITVAGQSNSLGFDTAYAVNGWGLTSNGTLFRADAAADRVAFNINKGFDLRPITFAADIFAASGFAVGPTGRVRVGTGYFDVTATGAALSADGAICTAGTLTAAVATTYAMDANFYYVDDPYGGLWRVTFTTGTSSLTGLTLLLAPVVKGTPPANPITLTPRGRLNIFGPGAITANLTWNAARTTLALQPTTGGTITMPALQASTTYANDAAAATGGVAVGGLYRNGSVIQIRVA